MTSSWRKKAGLSLTELLCVMALLSLLAALYLGAIAKAYAKVRAFLYNLGG